MTVSRTITDEAEDYVFDLFRRTLPPHLVFHDFPHTRDVVRTARKIAKEIGISDEALEIVTLAGWFHDAGYTEIYTGHEEVSSRIAREFLLSRSYPEEKITVVTGCIAATKVPQSPKNLLEEIICDADLSSLGRSNFLERSELLRIERELSQGITITDEEWLRHDLHFITGHYFHTKYAQIAYHKTKSENILILNEMLGALKENAPSDEQTTDEAKTIIIQNQAAKPLHKTVHRSIPMQSQRLLITSAVFVVVILLSLTIAMDRRPSTWHFLLGGGLIGTSMITMIYAFLGMKQQGDDEETQRYGSYLKWANASFLLTAILYGIGFFLVIVSRNLNRLSGY
jgi:hypothetical protein